MKILAIDTSLGKNLGLAVADNSRIILKESINFAEELSEEIVPAIERLLKKARLLLNSIDGFALNIGPGSFTGLRIGLSCIKALSLATGKPIVGISSLDILAEGLDVDYQICSIIDAKRENVYACFYSRKNEKIKPDTAYLLMNINSLLKKIKNKTQLVGDALNLYRDKISRQKKGICFFAGEEFWQPKIENLMKLAYQRFSQKKVDNSETISPIYLYPKECQIRQH